MKFDFDQDELIGLSSTTDSPLHRIGEKLLERWRYEKYFAGTTDADPRKVIYVDPSEIRYVTGDSLKNTPSGRHFELIERERYLRRADFGDVLAGAWDRNVVRFTELSEWKLLRDRFVRSVEWEKTTIYPDCRRTIEQGGNAFGCSTIEQLHRRFQYLEEIKESIEHTGYKRHNHVEDDGIATHVDGPARLDEVTVDIGSTGELLFHTNGRHRLALAKILAVPEIPVLIKLRHADWQRLRNVVRANDGPNGREFGAHPDLEDVRGRR